MSKPSRSGPAAGRVSSDAGTGTPPRRDLRWGVLLAVVTVMAFSPLLTAEFTNWDDQQTIAFNPRLNPPSLEKLLYFWDPRHPYMDLYVPVTYTVWSAVAAVAYVPDAPPGESNLNSWLFHGLNVALHAASALAAFALLRRFIRGAAPAAAGALLFALHPVQVESVGWASGTKDVLWGLLSLVALWQYVCFAQAGAAGDTPPRRRAVHYAFATVTFALAMLSKPTAVVVPVIAALLDLTLLRRPLRNVFTGLLPWLLLAIPIVVEGKLAQPAALVEIPNVAPYLRPFIAADALTFYFYKTALPVRLAVDYSRTPGSVLAGGWVCVTWVVPATAAALTWVARRRFPWLVASAGIFVLSVAPVLGLVRFDFQAYSTVADHYLYLAMLGPGLGFAFATERVAFAASPAVRRRVWIGCGVVLAALAIRTFFQTFHWKNSVTLFQHATRVNPNSVPMHTQLGEAWAAQGDVLGSRTHYERALASCREAVRLRPDSAQSRTNLASVLAALKRDDEAAAEYREALRLDPAYETARIGLERLAATRASTTSPSSRPPG